MARRECRVAHLAKILMPRRKARAAEMGAPDRVAREPAAMPAKTMPAAAMSAKVMPAAAMAAKAMSAAVPVAATVTSSVAAASGEYVARQRQHEGKNRNSHHAQ
jgi:hypothetical protein